MIDYRFYHRWNYQLQQIESDPKYYSGVILDGVGDYGPARLGSLVKGVGGELAKVGCNYTGTR